MSDRWSFMSGLDIGQEDPYLDRLRLVRTPLFGVFLHHIHRADGEPDPHDHPWWFASLVLSGGYTEKVWASKTDLGQVVTRRRVRWSLRATRLRGAHIITEVKGSLWTLVIVGPRRADWGFWTPRGFVPWRDYWDGGRRP